MRLEDKAAISVTSIILNEFNLEVRLQHIYILQLFQGIDDSDIYM